MRSLSFTLPSGNYIMTLYINDRDGLTLGNVIIDECFDENGSTIDPNAD